MKVIQGGQGLWVLQGCSSEGFDVTMRFNEHQSSSNEGISWVLQQSIDREIFTNLANTTLHSLQAFFRQSVSP